MPACRAEIRKSTRRTVQQHTPTFLCSTKYHAPIHGAPRVPVRKATPSSLSPNPRGKNYSRRSRRCIVTAPLLSRHVRPRYCAVQRFLRAFSLFLVQPASQDGEPPFGLCHQVTSRIRPNPVSRCDASSIAVPVGNIGAMYAGYDHTERTGDACQVGSGPENCKNEYRAMQPSWCDAKPAWFAPESARAYCPMYLPRLGPVSSVVAGSQAR